MPSSSEYNASLQSVVSLSLEQRKAAEARFLKLLEIAFGSASKVRRAYCERLAVRSPRAENPWEKATTEEIRVITHGKKFYWKPLSWR